MKNSLEATDELINEPSAVLHEFLEGFVSVSPGLELLPNRRVVVRSDFTGEISDREVALISGGGSGHEPAHAGYVGAGMLSAAVAGDVFTSPSVDVIVEGIRAVTGRAGAVLIVKNYTGDRLNFGLAAEIARAEGLAVEYGVGRGRRRSGGVGLRRTRPSGYCGHCVHTQDCGELLQRKVNRLRLSSRISRPLRSRLEPWGSPSRRGLCPRLDSLALLSAKTKSNLGWAFMARRASSVRPSTGSTTSSINL